MVAYTRTALGPEFDGLVDDTVVSLLGSLFHRDALADLYLGLRNYRRGHGLPWAIGKQAKLSIPREVGSAYSPVPDLFIHPALDSHALATVSIARYGPPTLVIEVVSGTLPIDNDHRVGIPGGKAAAYAASGVAEYLVFDRWGEFIPESVAAWRLDRSGEYRPWEPDANLRWASSLGIAFAPQGATLRAYDETGMLIPSYEELAALAMKHERELAARREEVHATLLQCAEQARENAELRRLRGENETRD